MENYEDSYTYSIDFTKYYPCYRDLSVEQLRGYFTWRKNVRNKVIEKAPLPFVYIYIYELINCIGAEKPVDCFALLRDFLEAYSLIDNSIKKYADNWLMDFIVYYELDNELARDMPDFRYDISLLALMHWNEHTESELFDAITALSSYQFQQSLYYISEPDEFRTVLLRSFVKISEFYSKKRKISLFTKLFGNIAECSHNIFQSAIFYDRQSLRSCEYILNEIHTFKCKNGKWSCKKLYGNRSRSGRLGDLVKAVDSLLREKKDFRHKISCTDVSKTVIKIIQDVIDEYFDELRREEAKKITIDISKLSGIRKAADITREKLLVDEEEETEKISVQTDVIHEVSHSSDIVSLDKEEKEFITALLYNGDPAAIAKNCGKLPSILSDSVNEKMFEHFSDNIIDFSENTPQLIEDYTDELKEMFHKE